MTSRSPVVLSKEVFKIHAEFCKLFSSPVRLMIMWELGIEEKTVSHLAKRLEISVSNVSQHLRLMRSKNVVTTRRNGQQIFYRVSNPRILDGYQQIRMAIVELTNLHDATLGQHPATDYKVSKTG